MGFTLWVKLSPINIVELASTSPKACFQDSQPLRVGSAPRTAGLILSSSHMPYSCHCSSPKTIFMLPQTTAEAAITFHFLATESHSLSPVIVTLSNSCPSLC